MAARSYKINLLEMIRFLIPPYMRSPKNRTWIYSLLYPVEEKNDELLTYVEDARYRANVTGQVISLQDYLNRLFDATERRIVILDGNQSNQAYDWFDNEGQPLDFMYFDTEPEHADDFDYFANETDTGFAESFGVFIPTALSSLTSQISAEVDKYKLAGKDYTVTT